MGEQLRGEVAFAKIFPPIGIARVGDSDAYFLGAEHDPTPAQLDDDRYRDGDGRVKRQGARFRIYGFSADGTCLGELDSTCAEIAWSVHLANKKAAWFRFDGAEKARKQFRGEVDDGFELRNAAVGALERSSETGRYAPDDDRKRLEIDGGLRSIQGENVSPDAGDDTLRFVGAFRPDSSGLGGHPVYLGELRTDALGRLVVLGGHGVSLPVNDDGPIVGDGVLDYWITNYANNDFWCDDTADGPVTATVTLKDGRGIPVEGAAWVIVAPPDFAPDVTNLVTLYDVMEEVAVAGELASAPGTPILHDLTDVRFKRDIKPILERADAYRWVSPLGLRGHGSNKPGDASEAVKGKLEDSNEVALANRARFFSIVRTPSYPGLDPKTHKPAVIDAKLAATQATAFFMPPLSGDEGDREPGSPDNWLSLTRLQYQRLDAWRKGSIRHDVAATPTPTNAKDGQGPSDSAEAIETEPARLTRRVLEACAGGAFFPGIEMTAVAREASLYCEPFRIDHTQLSAGDITKFMACPWQADFYECRDTWWPAQRPDTVITDQSFEELYDSFVAERGDIENLMFRRERWDRGLERRPRPSREYLMRRLLPEPTAPDVAAYATLVAGIASRALLRPTLVSGYVGFTDVVADAETARRLPSPWRLQYLVQEALDGYAGRYFLPTVPDPAAILQADRAPKGVKPPKPLPTLDWIRQNWSTLREQNPGYAGGLLGDYARSIQARLKTYLTEVVTETPPPKNAAPSDPALTPAQVLRGNLEEASGTPSTEPTDFVSGSDSYKRLRAGEFVTQLVSRLFLNASVQAPDMAMVDGWRELGFVRSRIVTTGEGDTVRVQVETERAKYAGRSFRDYFYYLMNIPEYQDFLPYCRTIADEILNSAQRVIDNTSIFDPNHPESFAAYSPTTFAAKLEQIYEVLRAQAAAAPNYVYNATRQERVRALTGNAPFNQVDGAWLRYAANTGTMGEVTALLFSIWSDEIGNGDPALHHGNLYTTLLKSLGVQLPEVTSRAYVDDARFDEATFVAPVFELAISQHSQDYFPELLGMTLFLEWEVLSLVPGSKRLEYFGIDAQFFRMHIGIDNASEGHGAMARRAVELYLDQVLRDSGAEAQQAHWLRIWRGFVAFATAGYDFFANIGPEVSDGMSVESETQLHGETPADQLASLMDRKRAYGNLNHLKAKLGPYRLNDLFDDPPLFLAELEYSSFIVPGNPDESRFLNLLTTFQGPMYKVFTDKDLGLWRAWIEWLGREGDTPRPKAHITRSEAMRALLSQLQPMMAAASAHQLFIVPSMKQADGSPMRLSQLFASADPVQIMRVLRDPQNGWIVPYRPAQSALIAELLKPANKMGAALDRRFPQLFNQVGRMVVHEWIAAGCPLPGEATAEPSKTIPTNPRTPRLFVQQYGMGAVH